MQIDFGNKAAMNYKFESIDENTVQVYYEENGKKDEVVKMEVMTLEEYDHLMKVSSVDEASVAKSK